MSRVKSRDTQPELLVRRLLHRLGYRFRLHRKDLPGKPDIVLPKYKSVIFVHGCFWHGHNCSRGKRPTSNVEFWNSKLDKNIDRDKKNQESLSQLGWRILTVWECEIRDADTLAIKLANFLTHCST